MKPLPPPSWYAVLGLTLLAPGCNGKPEDASAYTSTAPAVAAPTAAETKSPAPPYPAWAAPMIGREVRDVTRGAAVCKGALDAVTLKHTGARPGAEIEGWGWDEQGARPLDKVLLVDSAGRVVGSGVFGKLRPDVPKAVPEVKTPAVGWKGVAGMTRGEVQAMGVTAGGGACPLGRTTM